MSLSVQSGFAFPKADGVRESAQTVTIVDKQRKLIPLAEEPDECGRDIGQSTGCGPCQPWIQIPAKTGAGLGSVSGESGWLLQGQVLSLFRILIFCSLLEFSINFVFLNY